MMTKAEVRKQMRQRRKEYAFREESSREMVRLLLDSSLYRRAETILSYVPFRQEPDLLPVLQQARKDGKKTGIPQILGPGVMVFRQGNHPERWTENSWGIQEPDSGEEEVAADSHTLILVPGLAFDHRGGRLGYGGGFYDRYLQIYPMAVSVGTAFHFQVVSEIPLEPQDQRVRYILTEKGIKCIE